MISESNRKRTRCCWGGKEGVTKLGAGNLSLGWESQGILPFVWNTAVHPASWWSKLDVQGFVDFLSHRSLAVSKISTSSHHPSWCSVCPTWQFCNCRLFQRILVYMQTCVPSSGWSGFFLFLQCRNPHTDHLVHDSWSVIVLLIFSPRPWTYGKTPVV